MLVKTNARPKMATREENLKKINEELEKLSDEQLEKVAGGSIDETSYDSKLLYEHGLIDDWHGALTTAFHWKSYSAAVDEGWRKAGITCVSTPNIFANNLYYLNGHEISLQEARQHLEDNFPKIRNA